MEVHPRCQHLMINSRARGTTLLCFCSVACIAVKSGRDVLVVVLPCDERFVMLYLDIHSTVAVKPA